MALLQGSVAVCYRAPQTVRAGSDAPSARQASLLPSVAPFLSSKGFSVAFGRCVGTCVEDGGRSLMKCLSSGGTRRDMQKLTARTKRRRARHMKGVTPTKQDMLDELGREVTSDEILAGVEDFEGDDEGVDDTDEYSLFDSDTTSANAPALEDKSAEQSRSTIAKAANDFHGSTEETDVSTASPAQHVVKLHSKDGARQDSEGSALDAVQGPQDSVQSDRQIGREYDNQRLDDNRKQGTAAVEDASRAVQDQAGTIASDLGDQAREAVTAGGNIAEIAQDAIAESGEQLSRAGEVVGRDLSEVGDAARKVADVGQETIEESGEQLTEASDAVAKNISVIADEGQSLVQEGQEFVGTQARKGASELQRQGDEVIQTTQAVLEMLNARAQTAAQRVQDSSISALTETAKAAEVFGSEIRGIGEVLVDAAGEAVGLSSSSSSARAQGEASSSDNDFEHESRPANGKVPTADTSRIRENVEKGKQEETDSESAVKALKVLVASDTGRLGRFIVEELNARGATVSTLTPVNSATARNIRKLENVQVIEENVYSYEVARKALANSDAVICTIGNEVFPFDPLKTYQVTYEGVLNLVAAAKNQGNIKKFILVTSLGVTQLQLLPFLFWRKQTELFLQRSGLDYIIVRPGLPSGSGSKAEAIELHREDTQLLGFVGERKVAELCVSALTGEASDKVVEVVAGRGRSSGTDVTKLLQNFR